MVQRRAFSDNRQQNRTKEDCQRIPQPPYGRTPWNNVNQKSDCAILLVAKTTERRRRLRKGVHPMSGEQNQYTYTEGPLVPSDHRAEARPFQTVAMDFITKLPLSDGYDTILTITDQGCTKMALFLPCSETITAEGVAHLYMHHVFKRFGLPTKIISDRDTHFTSRFAKDLCRHLGIMQNISMAYHPCTDGQSERTNQWLEQYLQFWTNHKQNNWTTYLPIAEFAHNTWYNATTKMSPFRLLMGYEPRATWEISKSPLPQITTRLDQMIKARQVAHEAQRAAEALWERRKHQQRFQEGDQVWLEGRNIHTSHPTAKLAPKRYGPFPITKVLGPVTYQRPLPDLINGEEEYKVERIINSRRFRRGRQVQYLVHWKGYPELDNQWIPWSNLNAPELVAEFQQENPDAVTHIRTAKVDKGLSVPPPLPPTSLPITLYNLVYMSDGPTTLLTSPAPAQGQYLALYEAAAAEVGDDTTGSALLQRIVAISMAAAASGASEVGSDTEEDDNQDEGV